MLLGMSLKQYKQKNDRRFEIKWKTSGNGIINY